jgi:hypothetical protein
MKHDPRRTFGQNGIGATVSYIFMDVLCAGLGMGVPVFCILLGFPLGWFAARRAELRLPEPAGAMRRALRYAFDTSAFTMALMLLVWSWAIRPLFNPLVDCGSMGVPLILYEPRIILMVVVSPFLQFLMSVFGAFLTFQYRLRKGTFGSGR